MEDSEVPSAMGKAALQKNSKCYGQNNFVLEKQLHRNEGGQFVSYGKGGEPIMS